MTVAAHARALVRHRRGLAMALVQGCPESVTLRDQGPTGSLVGTATARAVESLLDGRGTFDVARARTHARELIQRPDDASLRVARRLLEALEGQPSECQGAPCVNMRNTMRALGEKPHQAGSFCPDCHGTGHNLAGKLPALRPSPQVCWRRADQGLDEHGVRTGPDTWLDDPDITGYMHPGWGCRTDRVVPRGEHRGGLSSISARPENATARAVFSLDERITSRGWSSTYRVQDLPPKHTPRWRRGELRHAQQRRERAQQRDVDAVREEWSYSAVLPAVIHPVEIEGKITV